MSQLPDPAFAQPSTGWTEEMEAAARRTRPAPPPLPRWRVALRVSAWGAVIALLVAIVSPLISVALTFVLAAFYVPAQALFERGQPWQTSGGGDV